jgi:hypothetical protein
MPRLLLAIFACSLLLTSVQAQTCIDIQKFDFRNATIHIAIHDENKATGLFNGSEGMVDVFHLKGGVGFQSDDPDNAASHDWQINLVTTHLLHPDNITWVRVVELERDHLTGTGLWSYVLAFTCAQGRLRRIFQYSGQGVSLEHFDDRTLNLYQAVWSGDDSHMDPSHHRELIFSWDDQEHDFGSPHIAEGPGYRPSLNSN